MITEQEQALLDLVSRESLVELTRELVRIDSVIRPESGNTEKKVTDFIAGWVKEELGIDPVVEEVATGRENIIVISIPEKIFSLGGQPLLVDSGDPETDRSLEGHIKVVTGYGERMVYPVASGVPKG